MEIHQELPEKQTWNRSGTCQEATLSFIVTGGTSSQSVTEALELVRQNAPSSVGSALFQKVSLAAVRPGGTYEINAVYSFPAIQEEKKAGDVYWSIEVVSRRCRITQGLELVRSFPQFPEALTPGLLINWDGRLDGNSQIAGSTAWIPEYVEKCTVTYRVSSLNNSFRRKIAETVGHINASAFHGWKRGEVLLVGISQGAAYENRSGVSLADITYRFAISLGGTRKSGGVSVSDVGGWNVLWNVPRRDACGRSAATAGVYETRIYDYANFSSLNL